MNAIPTTQASDTADACPDRILGGLAYLQQVLDRGLPFAVVTGTEPRDRQRLIRRFLTSHRSLLNLAHVDGPTHDPHAFLQSVLIQLGFEPFESSASELQSLLDVFVQHEAAHGRRTAVVVENLQNFGPRVLATIQDLAAAETDAALTVLLTGDDALNRVLDSTGMLAVSAMTGWRYVLDDAAPSVDDDSAADGGTTAEPAELVVSLDGKLVSRHGLERAQLTIGRNEHNDVCIVSRYVSRHHALLVNRADGAYIVDLKSTNGTFVNSKAISQHALKHGDVVSIGNFRLKYHNPAVPRATGLRGLEPSSFAETSVMRSGQWLRPELEVVPPAPDRRAGGD
jgi:hypothetical protein